MKKGISAVVATVLIILITVAAITIIWAAIIPMIKNTLTEGTECLDAQAEVTLGSTGYTCINRTSGNISLQIGHGPKDFDIESIQVIVHVGGNTYEEKIVGITTKPLPGSNEEKVFTVTNTSTNPSYKNASKVEIAPVIKVGNTQKNCGISQSVVLSECA